MVFGTPMMVTVALKLDGPIKLLFPRGSTDAATCKPQFSLLGLGDLVIPGLMIALLLRLDAANAHARSAAAVAGKGVRGAPRTPQARFAEDPSSFPAPYFNAGILSYVAGLAATVLVMVRSCARTRADQCIECVLRPSQVYFEAAQPALLYLVPAVLAASFSVSVARGEVPRLLGYSDDEYSGRAPGGRRWSVVVQPDVPGGSGGPVDDALPDGDEDAVAPTDAGANVGGAEARDGPGDSAPKSDAAVSSSPAAGGGARRRTRQHA